MSNRKALFSSVTILFILVAYTSMHVPLHSDDFHYLLKGITIDAEIKSYMTWSGRLVSDMLSPLLLNFLPVKIIGILNAACIVLLILFISMLPKLALKSGETSWFTFSTLFMLYWIANPSLGETSFWIVGASNYLWTNLFVLSFFLFTMVQEKDRSWVCVVSLTLGFLAGCSNENTAPIVTLMTLAFSVYNYRRKRLIFSFFGLAGNISGACVLLLSPGNEVRAATFTEWAVTPFKYKIFEFAIGRFEHSLEVYWQIYIVIAAFMVITSLSVKDRHARIHLKFAMLFFIIAILANAAFVISPVMPERSLNGALVLMLISASFVLSSFNIDNSSGKAAAYTILSFCIPLFLISYYLFTTSVIANYYQSKVRVESLEKQKNEGKQVINIPSLYFTSLLKSTDQLNSADGRGPMAAIYGVKDINYSFPDFDYSQVRRASYFQGHQPVYKDLAIERIYFYRESVFSGYKLIVQFNKPLSTIGSDKVFLHILMKDNVSLGADIGNVSFNVAGKSLAKSRLGFYSPDDIVNLTFGVYTLPNVKVIEEHSVNISEFKRVKVKGWH